MFLVYKKRKYSIFNFKLLKKRLFFLIKKLKKAFTLIELLVVIAIIALLSTLSVVALSNTRVKARDVRRLSDIKTITTGLEMYYNDFGSYPSAPIPLGTPITNLCFSDIGITSTCGTSVYSGKLPGDPIGGRDYFYTPLEDNGSYAIAFALETGAANYIKGDYTATPAGIVPWVCGDDVVFNYNSAVVIYGTVFSSVTNKCWLDRNLGASRVAQSSDDDQAYGDLFQWGRSADGHQLRTPPSGSTIVLSAIDKPGHDSFITNSNSPRDWRNPQNNNLWQGLSGINNPCPVGFRLPTEVELDAERVGWISQDPAGAFVSPLKFTTAGSRRYSNGSLVGVGLTGDYWSSTINEANSRSLSFFYDHAGIGSGFRANGCSVRCIKD
jgi:prepilin-type N-terminal cleavage/methylation domain-containing protein/uncharacterized protein (TIGR02145 family)